MRASTFAVILSSPRIFGTPVWVGFLLRVLVAEPLPQPRDREVQEGGQFERHLALAGADQSDRMH